jgi:N-acyl homoserine lactone hydrolase
VNWLFLYGEHDDNYDLFGDGTIKTLFTPGHSPGHTSLVVTLEESGPMMLTADACYEMDHYNNLALPGLLHSASDVADSVQKIRRTVDALDATVVTGHDPNEWPKFKKAPEYYS